MAKSVPSIVTRRPLQFSLLLCSLRLTGQFSAAAESESLIVTPGPARIELAPGRAWLDVPEGYVYVNTPQELRKAANISERTYDPLDVAVVAKAGSDFDIIFSTSAKVDEATWQDAPSSEWKERSLAEAKASAERRNAATTPSLDLKVLGWYAEPTFVPGPPRQIRMPFLMQFGSGHVIVVTVGGVRTATTEIGLIAQADPQNQAAATAQMTVLMDSIRFALPPTPALVAAPVAPSQPAAVRQNDWGELDTVLKDSNVGKLILTAVCTVGAAALAFAKSVRRFVQGIFGYGSEPAASEWRNVRPQMRPPPPPPESDFPGT